MLRRAALLAGFFSFNVVEIILSANTTLNSISAVLISVIFIAVLLIFLDFFIDSTLLVCDGCIFGLTIGWLVHHNLNASAALYFIVNPLLLAALCLVDLSTELSRQNTLENNNIISDIELAATSAASINPKDIDFSMDELVAEPNDSYSLINGFRVVFNSIPKEMSDTAYNLSWQEFTSIEHRTDSTSCHICSAEWNGQPVILKLIKSERTTSAQSIAEFETEANILSRMNHPNIIRLIGCGKSPRPFLVLELLGGGTLSSSLGVIRGESTKRFGKRTFSYREALMTAYSLAKALHYLHANWRRDMHVVHRDVKPDNIGWTANGELKLFDFGLCACVKNTEDIVPFADSVSSPRPTPQPIDRGGAIEGTKAAERTMSRDSEEAAISTTAASVNVKNSETLAQRQHPQKIQPRYAMTGNTGTLRYMPPEVALGQPYNKAVDVFAFGIITWQVLKGKVPYAHLGKKSYMRKVVQDGQRPALDLLWPLRLKTLLSRCWHQDPDLRPDFGHVLRELKMLLDVNDRSSSSSKSRGRSGDGLNSNNTNETIDRTDRYSGILHRSFLSLRASLLIARPALLSVSLLGMTASLCLLSMSSSSLPADDDEEAVAGVALIVASCALAYVTLLSYGRVCSRRLFWVNKKLDISASHYRSHRNNSSENMLGAAAASDDNCKSSSANCAITGTNDNRTNSTFAANDHHSRKVGNADREVATSFNPLANPVAMI